MSSLFVERCLVTCPTAATLVVSDSALIISCKTAVASSPCVSAIPTEVEGPQGVGRDSDLRLTVQEIPRLRSGWQAWVPKSGH